MEKRSLNDCHVVPISKINLRDETFCLRFHFEDPCLFRSIREVGVLEPILLIRKGKRFTILSGFKRVRMAKTLKRRTVPAHVLDLAKPRALLELALAANAGRIANEMDRSVCLQKVSAFFPQLSQSLLERFGTYLGIEPSRKRFEKYVRLKKLVPELACCLSESKLTLREAVVLSRWPCSGQQLFYKNFLIPCHLSANERQRILEWIEDLKRGRGLTLTAILRKPTIQAVLKDQRADRRQRGEQLLKVLHQMRYPRLSSEQKRIEQLVGAVEKARVRLEADRTLEESTLKVSFPFRSVEEWKNALKSLSQSGQAVERYFQNTS